MNTHWFKIDKKINDTLNAAMPWSDKLEWIPDEEVGDLPTGRFRFRVRKGSFSFLSQNVVRIKGLGNMPFDGVIPEGHSIREIWISNGAPPSSEDFTGEGTWVLEIVTEQTHK